MKRPTYAKARLLALLALLLCAGGSACIWDKGDYQGGGRKGAGARIDQSDGSTGDSGSDTDSGYGSGYDDSGPAD